MNLLHKISNILNSIYQSTDNKLNFEVNGVKTRAIAFVNSESDHCDMIRFIVELRLWH